MPVAVSYYGYWNKEVQQVFWSVVYSNKFMEPVTAGEVMNGNLPIRTYV